MVSDLLTEEEIAAGLAKHTAGLMQPPHCAHCIAPFPCLTRRALLTAKAERERADKTFAGGGAVADPLTPEQEQEARDWVAACPVGPTCPSPASHPLLASAIAIIDALRARVSEVEAYSAEYVRCTDPLFACGPTDDPAGGNCGTCRCCVLASEERLAKALEAVMQPLDREGWKATKREAEIALAARGKRGQ